MKHTKRQNLRRSLGTTLRIAAFGLASAVGVVGAQAAEDDPITVSDEPCLSCAYADGLPVEEPGGEEFVLMARNDTSEFAGRTGDRARLVLPSRSGSKAERLPWNRTEKTLMWSFVSLAAVDAYQTMNAPGGVAEGNPMLGSWAGDHPSALETLAFKGATTYGMYKLAGKIKKRSTRRVALVLMNIVQASVVAHNESVTSGAR